MKKKELKLAWHYLTLIRAAQEDNNLDELSGLEFKLLAYIGWRGDKAYINEIVEHPAFTPYSFSTIKRGIQKLHSLDLIQSSANKSLDSRINYLTTI